MAANKDLDDDDLKLIATRMREIKGMKQSTLGYIIEFLSYGQQSLEEQQATAITSLASELAAKHGYTLQEEKGTFCFFQNIEVHVSQLPIVSNKVECPFLPPRLSRPARWVRLGCGGARRSISRRGCICRTRRRAKCATFRPTIGRWVIRSHTAR
jgi:hypothetical protein